MLCHILNYWIRGVNPFIYSNRDLTNLRKINVSNRVFGTRNDFCNIIKHFLHATNILCKFPLRISWQTRELSITLL